MKFSVTCQYLLKALQMVIGAVEKRNTQPLLGNVLIDAQADQLSIMATDTELEMVSRIPLVGDVIPGIITVQARKLLDICKNLSDETECYITAKDNKFNIQAGRSQFNLSTLPADDFPQIKQRPNTLEFQIQPKILHDCLNASYFSMALQDVRYYLNGLLIEHKSGSLRAVASDGHRLAMKTIQQTEISEDFQIIMPRKGVIELLRLLNPEDEQALAVSITTHYIRVESKAYTFTTSLVEARYPDYRRVIPSNCDKQLTIDKASLSEALSRVAILSNDKTRGVYLHLKPGVLRLFVQNTQYEAAEEELEINYQGAEFEVGFNVGYLLDVFNHIADDNVVLAFPAENNCVLIESAANNDSCYVVMPMVV